MKVARQGKMSFYPAPDLPGLEIVTGTKIVHSFPRHSHRKFCLGIVETGCRNFSYRGGVTQIVPGDILLVGPDEVHACATQGNTGHSYRMLCLEPGYLQRLFPSEQKQETRSGFTTKIINNPEHFQKLSRLFSALTVSGTVLAKECALIDVVGGLISKEKNTPGSPIRLKPRSVLLVQDYLEANYAENITVARLSQITGLSPYHLIRAFSEQTGLPPHSFQTQIRIKQAKTKLLQGQTIIDTALETGFVDQSHFTKIFKKWEGITPGEFMTKT